MKYSDYIDVMLPVLIQKFKSGQDLLRDAREIFREADAETIRRALSKVNEARDLADGGDEYFPIKYGKHSPPSLSKSKSKLHLLYHYLINLFQDREERRINYHAGVIIMDKILDPKLRKKYSLEQIAKLVAILLRGKWRTAYDILGGKSSDQDNDEAESVLRELGLLEN